MLKEILVRLFPDGRFIERSEIKLGTTVARGGSTLWGTSLTNAVIISRPIKKYENGSIGCDLRDFYEGSFYSDEMEGEWFYEINTSYPKGVNHLTNHLFNKAVIDVANHSLLTVTDYSSLEPGLVILASSAEEGDIEDFDTYWLPEITLFIVGGEDEYGWFVKNEPGLEPYPYTPVVKSAGKDNLWVVQTGTS